MNLYNYNIKQELVFKWGVSHSIFSGSSSMWPSALAFMNAAKAAFSFFSFFLLRTSYSNL